MRILQFDEIISPDYLDHGQSAYMGSPGGDLLMHMLFTCGFIL
jgi:hypothetical protein